MSQDLSRRALAIPEVERKPPVMQSLVVVRCGRIRSANSMKKPARWWRGVGIACEARVSGSGPSRFLVLSLTDPVKPPSFATASGREVSAEVRREAQEEYSRLSYVPPESSTRPTLASSSLRVNSRLSSLEKPYDAAAITSVGIVKAAKRETNVSEGGTIDLDFKRILQRPSIFVREQFYIW